MVSRIVPPSSELSKVIVSPAAAASMADRRVTSPAGGVALSSRESTTSDGPGPFVLVEHPPAARARASGMAKNIGRARFMNESPFPSDDHGRLSIQYRPTSGLFQIEPALPGGPHGGQYPYSLKSFMIEGMKNLRKTLLLALGVVLALSSVVAQQAPPAAVQAAPADKYALGQAIPVDPRITVGQLPNGLRYWIRENREPKNRAELRLVVKAGSVLEDKDQLG